MLRALLAGVFGLAAGVVIALVIGVLIIDRILPWDDICAAVAPMQSVAEQATRLIPELQAWLTQARAFLDAPGGNAAAADTAEARTGLGALLAQTRDLVGEVADTALDLLTAPLQALITLAQVILRAAQDALEAANSAVAAVDAARCE